MIPLTQCSKSVRGKTCTCTAQVHFPRVLKQVLFSAVPGFTRVIFIPVQPLLTVFPHHWFSVITSYSFISFSAEVCMLGSALGLPLPKEFAVAKKKKKKKRTSADEWSVFCLWSFFYTYLLLRSFWLQNKHANDNISERGANLACRLYIFLPFSSGEKAFACCDRMDDGMKGKET